MRVLPITEILALSKGESIPAFRGRWKKIGNFTSGQNADGQWSFQNCVMTDGNGEIKVKLKNRGELTKQWEGIEVYFESSVGTKKPFLGMIRDIDNFRNVEKAMIMIDERATMTEAGAAATAPQAAVAQPAPASAPAAVQPAQHVQQAPQPPAPAQPLPAPAPQAARPAPAARPASAPVPGSPEDQHQAVLKARKMLGRAANGLILAGDAAAYVANHMKEKHGVEFGPREIQAIMVSLNISLERGSFLDGIPCGPLPQKPEDAKQA